MIVVLQLDLEELLTDTDMDDVLPAWQQLHGRERLLSDDLSRILVHTNQLGTEFPNIVHQASLLKHA